MSYQKTVINPVIKLFTRISLFAVVLLSGCLPAGVRMPESPLLRNLERKSGLIALLGVDGNVYTTDQAGVALTPITTDANVSNSASRLFYQFPTWSPDGEQLAYVRIQASANIKGR